MQRFGLLFATAGQNEPEKKVHGCNACNAHRARTSTNILNLSVEGGKKEKEKEIEQEKDVIYILALGKIYFSGEIKEREGE